MKDFLEKQSEKTPILLIGMKSDLKDDTENTITQNDAEKLAKKFRVRYYECSAKKNINMKEMIDEEIKIFEEMHNDISISQSKKNEYDKFCIFS
jgi:GTPase SAR1 family protein